MKKTIFKGVATALYTPFTSTGIDFDILEKSIKRQLTAKVDALVILGTTGESPTINDFERIEIIKFTKSIVNGKIPIIVGTGSNDTAKAVTLTKQAEDLGVDGALIVTPYYNKCEQEGLYLHYEKIANATALPIICYNVPQRTGVNILPKTLRNLCSIKNIVGIKESSLDKKHIKEVFSVVDNDICVYCGSDELNAYFKDLGASGTISVASNVIPLKIKDIFNDFNKNYKIENDNLSQFYNALSSKVNPIPIKAMAEILYGEKHELRLPLTKANKDDFEYFKSILKDIEKEIFYD